MRWHGAQVQGVIEPQTAAAFEQAWPVVLARWGPVDLSGWVIQLGDQPVPCRERPTEGCHGTTTGSARRIALWVTPRILADLIWETCNAARVILTGHQEDLGCA